MNKNTEEYHSGDKSLMKVELDRVTGWGGKPEEWNHVVKDFKKYETAYVIQSRKAKDELGRMKDEYALFRKKIERVV